MHLRPYQEAAKAALYEHLRVRDDHPCVVLPTGGGKTPLLAAVCFDTVARWNGRVIVLAHVKELLQQAADKLAEAAPDIPVGVYSAGLKRRDIDTPVLVAGIQSVWKRACELGPFDLAVVDEAHLIPPDGDGMYRRFLADAKIVNPHLRVIGLTATPFRMKTGAICTPDGVLNHVCYEAGVRELIRDGFLCPLVSKAGTGAVDTTNLPIRAGEFDEGEAERLMDQDELVVAACAEVVELTKHRNAVLIFACGVVHAGHVARQLREAHGVECGVVTGKTPDGERAGVIDRFRNGQLKYLVNVNVLTTGFDASNVDAVVLLRPTLSPGLYYQMVGRGFRIHPSKRDCLVLDFGGNVLRHGPVDRLRGDAVECRPDGKAPAKQCPACRSLVHAGYTRCPDCGAEFPPAVRKSHESRSSSAGVLSAKITTTRLAVSDVRYCVHVKRGADEDAPKTLRVDYRVGWQKYKSEWICFEHTGWARAQAERWWKRRSADAVPDTAQAAADIANNGGLALATAISVRSVESEPYERIVDWELGSVPAPEDDRATTAFNPDDVPF
jgi:DNA repair protein RadD